MENNQKKLVPIGYILTVLVVYVLSQATDLVFNYYTIQEQRRVAQYQIPIIEKNNASSSLNARLGQLLYRSIIGRDKSLLAEFKKNKEELRTKIEEANELMLKSGLKSFRWLDRSGFERIENNVVNYIESKDYEKALESLNSEDYQLARLKFFNQIDNMAEQLKDFREEQIKLSNRLVVLNSAISILFLFITLFVGYKVFDAYRKNYKQMLEYEEKLKFKQIIGIRNSKMAELGEMAGSISHEINNPLAIIQGNVLRIRRAVEQSPIDVEKIEGSLQSIQNTIKRVTGTVSALQKFSRDTTNDKREYADIKQIIEDTISLCSFRLSKHAIVIKTDQVESCQVKCKPVDISQIILNLLNNSIEAIAHANERWIEISTTRQDDNVRISIKDSGAGISEENQNKIFENSYTTKKQGIGTGLGLSLSRTLAQQNKGSLQYDSDSPNTKFDVVLPLPHSEKFYAE